MWKKRDFQLTDSDLEIILQAMHHDKRPEVRPKAQALYLLHLEEPTAHVAKRMAVSKTTLYNWHDAWLEQGIDGLARQAGSGRPRKVTAEYEQLLESTLETDPSEHGYDFTIWTVDRLRAHLYEKTGIMLSDRALNMTLKRLGYAYRRPKHDLTYLHDPEAMEQAKAQLDGLKKKPEKGPSSSSLWTKRP